MTQIDRYGRVGMLVGHDRRNCGDTDDRDRGRPPDHSFSRCHQTPPTAKELVRSITPAIEKSPGFG